jgi:signal transduction histidine kinase
MKHADSLVGRPARRPLKVLVIGDDSPLLAALALRREADDRVYCFANEVDARAALIQPDLVVLSSEEALATRWPDVPVIVLTESPTIVDADAQLTKPVDPATLLATIERVVASAHGELARAEELQRLVSLGALLGGIAHEINNPLAFVFGSIDILQRQLVSLVHPNQAPEPFSIATAMRALERAREGAERVAAVVRSASMFASADLECIETLDIHQVLESAIQVASNEIRHGAHLVRSYVDVPHVRGNPARLGQVFLNLLLNAVYAIREHGGREHVIRVMTEVEHGQAVITISDSATSLEAAHVASLFDHGGSKLRFGLAVSRELVHGMGGSIEVTPRQPRGASFRVVLPISGEPLPAPAPKPPMRVSNEGASVLIIDDEPLLCELLSAMLSDQYAVAAFTSPRAALAALTERDFDAIVCDVMMPELNGMELFDRIARERPHLVDRFVFITGGAFTERARLFLKQTGRPVLRKPCERHELLDVVARIMVHSI